MIKVSGPMGLSPNMDDVDTAISLISLFSLCLLGHGLPLGANANIQAVSNSSKFLLVLTSGLFFGKPI